ncbi:MSMEG_6728 family protein [Paenarthrobacter sp. Z7-10]|uniref:MSMEG_6728 family protein n=1 Tax=Paenarthrobacter sp. Z7-10 TaxID=2787635 RepID=UPI0022A9A74A|nr:MSMEG_6728 family protein [Paenarthrobacter sp. Z7-10]MCZ2401895.1 MSMEG_6728 family protein [Paenarthrobacter sp. Z7-10]
MQTFLPYPDFARSAATLDRSRLGKQRVETLQILRALVIPDYGWRSHPAVRMWMGHIPALTLYGVAMADEWTDRGGADSTKGNIIEFAPQASEPGAVMPPWLGDPDVHRSHRSNLIRKAPEFYGPLFADDPGVLDYVWPEPPTVILPRDPEAERIWVLRMATGNAGDAGNLDPADGIEGETLEHIPLARLAPNGRSSPKWQRQVSAFISSMAAGDTVAVPLQGGLRFAAGIITGPTEETSPGLLTRPVDFSGLLERSAFRFPALLQDPRSLFPVPAPALGAIRKS